ncbi:MAG: hypothetical protein R3240_00695 [Gammaproteobacteria bacterium]|nr:hypothetical protein [Gammaproteobacteria bacterium]
MYRYYLCSVIGTGQIGVDDYRPVIMDLQDSYWQAVDGRSDATQPGGEMFVYTENTDAEHAALIADPRVTYLTSGYDELVSGDVTALKQTLETYHIPAQGIESMTVSQIAQHISKRYLLRQILGTDDFTESLDSNYGQLAAEKKSNIDAKLNALGLTSPRTGTIRNFIRNQKNQSSKWLRTHFDN